MSAKTKSKSHSPHKRSVSLGKDMGAQPECRAITSKHNKHKHRTSKSQEKVNNPFSDKSSQGNNNGPDCLVVKSKSEMRISSTREYCIMDPRQFRMSAQNGYMVPITGHRYVHNHTRKYHDYMNVVIPKGTGIVKEQMKMVVGDLENVLGELQTVVGDLQVLVNQIDIVTSKIDDECRLKHQPCIDDSKGNRKRSTLAQEALTTKGAIHSNALRQTPSESFDLIRRQMSSDYVFHAPVHRGSKPSLKFQTSIKEPSSDEEIFNKCLNTRKDSKSDQSVPFRKETHFPVRIQMANQLYEQAKKAHEERLKKSEKPNGIIAERTECTLIDAYDENFNRCKGRMFDSNVMCNDLLTKKHRNSKRFGCEKSISSGKSNQQYPSDMSSESSTSIIIPSPVSHSESDYCGVYERELDQKLELEFDDNLENYNGVDEGNTLELKNYTDYKLLQKLQPPNSLPSWRAFPPVGVASVDINTIEFSDDLQITTPTESSSDILNDNVVYSTPGSSRDNSLSIFDNWEKTTQLKDDYG